MNGETRNLKPVETDSDSADCEQWAIIVGISKYKDESLNLKYADRDAEKLYELLLTPVGGDFKEDHIKKLINEEATTLEIQKALRSFVKKAKRNDIFILYFACHGSQDYNQTNIIYLLTHDTEPDDISGTALPMDEIDRSLTNYLKAERVVIIADTCHSAAIGGGIGIRGAVNNAQATNAFLQAVSKSKGGVALLTSAEANQISVEGEQWDGGHGVFTHFLLQGMQGDADGYGQPKDGIVTVGELFEYVRDKVIEATDNKQNPAIGTNPFDRNLPMAFTIGINIQELYKLGLGLYELGWMLDDINRFKAAEEQFRKAIQMSQIIKTPHTGAELGLGKALAALGDYDESIQVLSKLIERDGTESSSEALFYLGIAQAKLRDYSAAESTFEKFLAHYPEDMNAAWVKEYTGWLNSNKNGRKYALLIGINKYTQISFNRAGCLNDVMFMKKVLTQRHGFEEKNVFTLLDQEATCQGILSAFESLSQKVAASDTVVIFYSGHGASKNQNVYLFAYDSTTNSDNCISPMELHLHMNAIPTEHKILILDTDPNSRFNDMAKKAGSYMLLLADPTESPYEIAQTIEGKTVIMGLFTYVLTQKLEESNSETLTYGELLDTAVEIIRKLKFDRKPILIGDREQLVFSPVDIYSNIFNFAQRRNYASMTPESINKLYSQYRKHTDIQPSLMHYSFGRAFLEKSNYDAAIDSLQTALKQCNENCPEACLALGKAQVSARHDSEALTTFKKYVDFAPEEMTVLTQQLIDQTEKLVSVRKHALLVGIDDYLDPSVTPVQGAVNDAQALKEVLLTKFDFQENDIKMLLNSDATRTAIMEAFKQLVKQAREEPALFYFAGNGSFNADYAPTIVSADGRQWMVYDIEIRELAELAANNAADDAPTIASADIRSVDIRQEAVYNIESEKLAELAANNASNLVTIVDAGWKYQGDVKDSRRTIPADTRERQAARDISEPRKLDQYKLRMGFLSIYDHSIEYSFPTAIPMSESRFKTTMPGSKEKYSSTLTQGLVRSLTEVDAGSLTYSQWFDYVSKQLGLLAPYIVDANLDELVFDCRTMRSEVLKLVTKLEQKHVFEAIELLQQMITQREQQGDSYPEGKLNLGVAYYAVGDYTRSVQTLTDATELYKKQNYMAYKGAVDPYPNRDRSEAHYQLGRVLFERNDFSRAESELEMATHSDPENARAYYYLGQAIQLIVKRETLVKAKKALQTYLEKGAPLGHEDEIRKFLDRV